MRLSSTSVLIFTVVRSEALFIGVSEMVHFLFRGPEIVSSMSVEPTASSFSLLSFVLGALLCANRESDERVVCLTDSKAVVVLTTFEVSRDIREVLIVDVAVRDTTAFHKCLCLKSQSVRVHALKSGSYP